MIEAIILAGGEGKRLRPVVRELPKPMAEVAGRPFLWWLLSRLSVQGVGRVVLSVGYKAEAIQGYFGPEFQGMEILYALEHEPLGTGGAIRLALQQVNQRHALVLNGDTYTDTDVRNLVAKFESSTTDLAMTVTYLDDVSRYGTIVIEKESDTVIGFVEKQGSSAGYINAGIYCLSRDIFEKYSTPEKFSFERDFMPARLEELRPVAFKGADAFIDIGIPEDYERAQTLIPLFAGKVNR
jgi:D-glycero-alpha-D-manno-heptose 1-phosphate guanylyltransferase